MNLKPARRIAVIAAWIAIIPLAQEMRAQDEIPPAEYEEKLDAENEEYAARKKQMLAEVIRKTGDYIAPPEGPVRSALGYEAVTAPFSRDDPDSEGSQTTIILKGDQFIARIKHARPVMFSPKGDILLLMEAAPDDDCRHALFNVESGEKAPDIDHLDRIGDRHSENPRWSKDGKLIKFFSLSDPSQDPVEETIVVAEHMGKKPQPEKSVKEVEQKVLRKQLEYTMVEMAMTEESLSQATTPEEKAAARLDLEKFKLWKQELENRISQSENSK